MMHIAVAAAPVVHVVAKINLGDTKVKITKQELAEIIREEVQNKLNEFIEFDDEGNPVGATPSKKKEEEEREVDEKGVPLKAPFPPGIKTTRELIKKFPYKSEERKLFRKWYKKYGPGSKRKKPKRSDFHPDVREALASADARIARIFTFHKNRPEEYTRKRLTNRRSWEHRSLKTALTLYGKAAKAGNRRAKREIAMVKQLMRGELRAFGKGPRAKKLPPAAR